MLLRAIFSTIIFLCLTPMFLLAQQDDSLPIASIEFKGAKKNKTSFLSSLIKCRKGGKATIAALETDVQALRNSTGIMDAQYHVDTLSDGLALSFQIQEVQTLLPIVGFGGIKGNVWFQLGFTDANWRGKGKQLTAYYRNTDRRHSGQIFYKSPSSLANPWGFSASIMKWSSVEPLYFQAGGVDYEYDNNSVELLAIRQIKQYDNISFGGSAFIETYNKSTDQELVNPPGPQHLEQAKYLIKTNYQHTNINYNHFYLGGQYYQLLLQNVYNSKDKNWFHSIQFQFRKYLRVKEKGNVALRLQAGLASNDNTPFAPFVVDSRVNLRGAGNRIDRGSAQLIFNAEYRHTILTHKRKLGIQAVAFSDFGSWRKAGGELKDIFNQDEFRHFIGGGLRFIYLPIYNAVLRIDYGVDIYDTQQNGFVIGIGQYF